MVEVGKIGDKTLVLDGRYISIFRGGKLVWKRRYMAYPLPDGNLYLYRRRVRITEQSGKTLTDYQIRIEIGAGDPIWEHARSAGEDIRFCYYPEEEMLSYWIEKYDPDAEEAIIWVKVPEIPANSEIDIYMYYGNPEVASASDGDATFEFFDDFEDGVIDTNKWGVAGTTENVVEEGGLLKITHAGKADPVVYGKIDFSYGYSMRLRVRYLQTNKDVEHGWSACTGAGTYLCDCGGGNGAVYFTYRDGTVYLRTRKDGVGATTQVLPSYDTDFHVWELVRNSASKVSLYKDDEYVYAHTTNIPTIDLHPAFNTASADYGGNSEIDFITVRKFTEPEPSVSVGAEE